MSSSTMCKLADAYAAKCWKKFRTVEEVHEALDKFMEKLRRRIS